MPRSPARPARRAAALLAGAALALLACGGETVPRAQGPGAVLLVQNYTFIPARVQVPAGGTVVVQNQDRVPHDLQSEAAAGDYAYGEVNGIGFDTGTVPPGGVVAITVPADAPVGTVVPFYCLYFTSAMTNQGELEIVEP